MSSSIFHSGPIDAAITSAVQQGISLVFFVTDGDEKSLQWETVYLRSPEVLPLLKKQSVLLRLRQGSAEAAFLAAFCPAQKVPYIAVVKNGALIANITNDVESRGEFIQQIYSAFPHVERESHSSAGPSSPIDPTAALFAERRARLEAQEGKRQAQEKAERDQRIARDKFRRETQSPARAKYVAEQRKIREDDLADRQRILRLVEHDKIERREKEARKQQVQRTRQYARVRTPEPEPGPSSNETAISFRLLDGTILKSKFASSSKLADVRQWLDKNRTDEALPYGFQQVLPNKSLSASDEDSTLAGLAFAHATTLVLVHRNE